MGAIFVVFQSSNHQCKVYHPNEPGPASHLDHGATNGKFYLNMYTESQNSEVFHWWFWVIFFMALAQGMPLKMDQEFPSNKFVIPIGFFKQKFTGELAGFENNPSDWRSRKKNDENFTPFRKMQQLFFTPEKKTRGCRSWSLPTSLRARWVSSEKKTVSSVETSCEAVCNLGNSKKPKVSLKFHWEPKWHSHQEVTGFPAIGHKVHASMTAGRMEFFPNLIIIILFFVLVHVDFLHVTQYVFSNLYHMIIYCINNICITTNIVYMKKAQS